MKTIIKILQEGDSDAELFGAIFSMLIAYGLVFFVFLEFHWMCGLMSPYVTTSLLRIGVKIRKTVDRLSDDEL